MQDSIESDDGWFAGNEGDKSDTGTSDNDSGDEVYNCFEDNQGNESSTDTSDKDSGSGDSGDEVFT